MNDIGQIVTAIQGNPIKREILGVEENNYVLTWSGVNDQWEAKSSGSDSNPGIKYNVKTINTDYSIQANIDSVVFVFTGICLTRDSWHTIIMAQKHLACPSLAAVRKLSSAFVI